jgi:hypothetical protein
MKPDSVAARSGAGSTAAKHAAVVSRETDRLPAAALHQLDDLPVDAAPEHHLDHLHGRIVGDAQAVHERRFDAEPAEGAFDLRAAAVHDDRLESDVLEQDHVHRERRAQLRVGHGVTAVFDDDGLVEEAPDVRQRLDQDLRLVDQLLDHPGTSFAFGSLRARRTAGLLLNRSGTSFACGSGTSFAFGSLRARRTAGLRRGVGAFS